MISNLFRNKLVTEGSIHTVTQIDPEDTQNDAESTDNDDQEGKPGEGDDYDNYNDT
jgi:hypothetical protein